MAADQQGSKPGAHPNHPHHHAHIAQAGEGAPVMQMVVVGAIVIAAAAGGFYWLNRKSEGGALNQLFVSQDARKIPTANGQRGDVTLSDGTKLAIGPASRLTIIPGYNEKYRGIKVEGTASITVATSNIPLEVRAGNVAMVADSGSFVVRSYDDEPDVVVKLNTGALHIRIGDARKEMAGPSAIAVDKAGAVTDASAEVLDQATGWADGKVSFRNMPLKDVLTRFEKYYALKMEVPDKALLDRAVTMDTELDSKQKAIAALEKSAEVKFGYDGTKPLLKDAAKKK